MIESNLLKVTRNSHDGVKNENKKDGVYCVYYLRFPQSIIAYKPPGIQVKYKNVIRYTNPS